MLTLFSYHLCVVFLLLFKFLQIQAEHINMADVLAWASQYTANCKECNFDSPKEVIDFVVRSELQQVINSDSGNKPHAMLIQICQADMMLFNVCTHTCPKAYCRLCLNDSEIYFLVGTLPFM